MSWKNVSCKSLSITKLRIVPRWFGHTEQMDNDKKRIYLNEFERREQWRRERKF